MIKVIFILGALVIGMTLLTVLKEDHGRRETYSSH